MLLIKRLVCCCLCIHVAIVSVVARVISRFKLPYLSMGTRDSLLGDSIHTRASACNRLRHCLCLCLDGPNSVVLRWDQHARPHLRNRRKHAAVQLRFVNCVVDRRHPSVMYPMKIRDQPSFVCCSKAILLSSGMESSFKMFCTRSSSIISVIVVKSS